MEMLPEPLARTPMPLSG